MENLSQAILLSIVLTLAVTTAVAVATSYGFYRWRKTLTLEGKVVTIPEELIATLSAVSKRLRAVESSVARMAADTDRQGNELLRNMTTTDKTISQLFEAFVSLQSALDQRDAEINRLKRGYDADLTRRFVARFIRVKMALADAENLEATDPNTLHQIRRLLDDALDECGVEEFKPGLNEDFRSARGVADNPRILETEEASKHFKIADVLEPGYRFRTGEADNIILPARVSVFVARNSGE